MREPATRLSRMKHACIPPIIANRDGKVSLICRSDPSSPSALDEILAVSEMLKEKKRL